MEDYERNYVAKMVVNGYCKYMQYKGITITQKPLLRHFLIDIMKDMEDVELALENYYKEDFAELIDPEDIDCISLEDLERDAYNNLVVKPQINDLNKK